MRAVGAYRRAQVECAPNEEVVVMLLELAVRREDDADAAMARGDRAAWNEALHVARAVFLELTCAFDARLAPEVAGAVLTTYRWAVHHLIEAGKTGDRERLARVRAVTEGLRATWAEALRLHRGEEPS